MTKLTVTRRAKEAVAAIFAVATLVGGVLTVNTSLGSMPAAIVLATETLVQPWEGRELRAYLDTIPDPDVWTICDGDTQNVRPGMVETPAGCDRRLQQRMFGEFYPKLRSCIDGFEFKPLSWQAMMFSLSWNIGHGGACKSTAAELGRQGKYVESCQAATRFNRSGGQVIIGLVKRREMGDAKRIGEGELCVSGLGK
jgi:lysozyme